ncbi:MAG: aspartate aminotransferase family protein [Ktedonobacterales bacterium]
MNTPITVNQQPIPQSPIQPANATMDGEDRYEAATYRKRPIRLVRGAGAVLEDDQGRQYIDCTAGIGVANIGHANPHVAQAIARQAERLITCPEMFYNDTRAAYLERLVTALPNGLDRVFLCNSGTEAVEAAIKFTRLATGRTEIVAALRGFHGRTLGALSATWEPRYRTPFEPLVPGFRHVRFNDATALSEAVTERTAAVLLEVVQGEGGVHIAEAAYLHAAERLCRERGALLILDEVQTGFGRTGRLWACEHAGITPDLLCLAKGIAGGLPMGATCLGPRVGNITPGTHGSTFGGNPLACAAAGATLDELHERRLPQRAAELGASLLERLRATIGSASIVREVRGLGLMLGIELCRHVQPYIERLAERGILALNAGPYVIRLLPPLVIEQAQIEQVAEAIEEVLR